MSAERDALVRAAFEELHQEFATRLPDRIGAIVAAVAAASASRDDLALREEAQNRAHKLRGSAGSYGFPAISATAARLEEAFVELGAIAGADAEATWATITESVADLERALRAG
jgi:HPt (histidine-containing phosphotransfer) domain-containing protein